MFTTTSIYSTSPPTSIPGSCNSSSNQVSATCTVEIDFHIRSHTSSCQNSHNHVSRPIIGGLSSIFANSSGRYMPCTNSPDAGSVEGNSLPRRSSHNDISALIDASEKKVDSPFLRERTPNSTLSHGYQSLTSKFTKSSVAHGEARSLDHNPDLYYLNDLKDWSDMKPPAPLLTKMACSSISDFFCKPLYPDALIRSREILRNAQRKHEVFKDPVVIQGFKEADQAHSGQIRANGDPYLVHCVETATILAEIGANKVVVAAGLLHDTVDDSSIDHIYLEERFGSDVANLVTGVSKLSEFSKLARDNNTAYKSVEADRLHTMMLAMTDVQVVLIKLADRLHNMRTLGALPREKRMRLAKETLEVFVPLAGRLGIWSWKAEMEDLCFKYLDYENHRKLSRKLAEGFREKIILSSIQTLYRALLAKGVEYLDLCGRPKTLHSIHRKMVRKGRKIEEIYDAQGLRLIVADVADCYTALDVVHTIWPCVPGKKKDYISQPKQNGYQSLHTVVWGEDGLPLEIQIRTMEMHHQAEFGVAAHWRYKEGNVPHSSFVMQTVEWARWVLTWQNEIKDMKKLRMFKGVMNTNLPCSFPFHNEDCPYLDLSFRPPYDQDNPLFVIVVQEEKMMVQEVPGNSTVADFLEGISNEDYLIGVDVVEARLRVNHNEVKDVHHKLQMGDLIEVVPEKSLDDYREEFMRIYDDCSIVNLKKNNFKPSRGRLSEVAVF